MRKLVVKILYVIYAFKKINKPHIGDTVMYIGFPCMLIQGVANPYWDLMPLTDANMKKEKREVFRYIHVSDFKLENTLKRKYWAFHQSYKFKMQNWFMIDTWNKSLFSPISKH
jgi:hypothetical protein